MDARDGGRHERIRRPLPAGIRIQTMPEYRRYCYYVAGTVGHLLTDLWYCHSRLFSKRDHARLLVNCEAFGEALQTINILKDIAWDIEHENAAFVPEELFLARGSSHSTMLEPRRQIQNRDARRARRTREGRSS
jgi:farnesyl-diphosphate farnesyltransferase